VPAVSIHPRSRDPFSRTGVQSWRVGGCPPGAQESDIAGQCGPPGAAVGSPFPHVAALISTDVDLSAVDFATHHLERRFAAFAGPVAMDTGRRQAICAPGRSAYRRDRRQLDAHPDPGGPCHHRPMQLPRSPTSPRSPRPVSDTTHLLLVPSRACVMSPSCHQRRRPTARESALISLRLARLRDRSISLPTIYVRCRAYQLPGSAAVPGAPRVIGSRRCVTTTRCPR
jgi:hypothetical protein